jgi:hypothetical protein
VSKILDKKKITPFKYPLSPPASPALGHELGPNGAARDGGQAETGIQHRSQMSKIVINKHRQQIVGIMSLSA